MHRSFTARSQPASLRLSLPCDLGAVRGAVQAVHNFLIEQGWGDEELMSFDLALVEACNNAVKYAGAAGRAQPIELEANSDATQVEFRVHDHSPGFEWPRNIQLPDQESESGRGIYLIHSLMDYAGYFRGRGENILVMRKRRSETGKDLSTLPPVTQQNPPDKRAEHDGVVAELVEELSSCYESLSAIFRYSTEQSKAGSLKEFAQRLFGDLLQIIAAEWFVLRIGTPERVTARGVCRLGTHAGIGTARLPSRWGASRFHGSGSRS